MFRLDKVLHWKEVLERRARVERASAEAKYEGLAAELRRLRNRRDRLPDRIRSAGDAKIVELAEWSAFVEGLRRREQSLIERMDAFRPEMEEKISVHLELRKDVEGLKRLRERAEERRKHDQEKRHQEVVDDAAARTKLPEPGTDFRPGTGDVTRVRT